MRTSKRVSGQIPPAYSHLSQLGRDPPIKPLWSKEGGREREREGGSRRRKRRRKSKADGLHRRGAEQKHRGVS